MSQSTGFISHRTLTLEKNGTYKTENVTGSVFICTMASFTFEMQFNDGGWFHFDQGLQFNIGPDRFTKLAFRALNTDEDTDIEFYTGGAAFADARLNIIRDPNHYQILNSQSQTLLKPFAAATIAAGAEAKFYGTGGSGAQKAGALYAYRKAIVVTNNDPDSDLEVYKVVSGALTDRIGTVFARQGWMLETSDDVGVKNETVADIACRVCEIFYPA